MVKQLLCLTLTLLLLLVTVISLCLVNEKEILLGLGLIAQLEMLFIIWNIVNYLGRIKPRTFRFIHLQNYANKADTQCEIISEISIKELKNIQQKHRGFKLIKWLKSNHIFVEEAKWFTLTKTTWLENYGLIYAKDKTEALRIIGEHQFYGTD